MEKQAKMKLKSIAWRAARSLCREMLRRDREYLSRQFLFETVAGFIADCRIEGDYLEFGCADGTSLVDMFDAVKQYHQLRPMHFYIFDSFEGLPEPSGLDGDVNRRYAKGDFSCSLSDYKRNVVRGGVDLTRVTCTPGWYNESLSDDLKQRLPLRKAAIILVDCDLYESTVPVLNFITDYIQSGTIIIFDDWFSYKGRLDLGEAKAFDEWLTKNPKIKATEYQKAGRTMTSFILQPN
jgi:O-methyltransferase